MSYYNNTTCIRSDDLDLIERVLTDSFKKEGFVPILQPPFPANCDSSLLTTLSSSDYMMEPYIWVVGLYTSKLSQGWTVIKTSVPQLFCCSRKGNDYPRLSDLAMETGCDAFHHYVSINYYNYCGVLLEAAESGEIVASGYVDNFLYIEDMKFYNEPVIQNSAKNFLLLDVPETFQQAGKKTIPEEVKQKRIAQINKIIEEDPCASGIFASEYSELTAGSSERLDRDLNRLSCNCSFWHTNRLLFDCYDYYESQNLESLKVRLLFFQVGAFELDTDSGEIWKVLTDFSPARYAADYKKLNLRYC